MKTVKHVYSQKSRLLGNERSKKSVKSYIWLQSNQKYWKPTKELKKVSLRTLSTIRVFRPAVNLTLTKPLSIYYTGTPPPNYVPLSVISRLLRGSQRASTIIRLVCPQWVSIPRAP